MKNLGYSFVLLAAFLLVTVNGMFSPSTVESLDAKGEGIDMAADWGSFEAYSGLGVTADGNYAISYGDFGADTLQMWSFTNDGHWAKYGEPYHLADQTEHASFSPATRVDLKIVQAGAEVFYISFAGLHKKYLKVFKVENQHYNETIVPDAFTSECETFFRTTEKGIPSLAFETSLVYDEFNGKVYWAVSAPVVKGAFGSPKQGFVFVMELCTNAADGCLFTQLGKHITVGEKNDRFGSAIALGVEHSTNELFLFAYGKRSGMRVFKFCTDCQQWLSHQYLGKFDNPTYIREKSKTADSVVVSSNGDRVIFKTESNLAAFEYNAEIDSYDSVFTFSTVTGGPVDNIVPYVDSQTALYFILQIKMSPDGNHLMMALVNADLSNPDADSPSFSLEGYVYEIDWANQALVAPDDFMTDYSNTVTSTITDVVSDPMFWVFLSPQYNLADGGHILAMQSFLISSGVGEFQYGGYIFMELVKT